MEIGEILPSNNVLHISRMEYGHAYFNWGRYMHRGIKKMNITHVGYVCDYSLSLMDGYIWIYLLIYIYVVWDEKEALATSIKM